MFSPATNTLNNNDFDWVYDPRIMNYQPPEEPLQEPVPFEGNDNKQHLDFFHSIFPL